MQHPNEKRLGTLIQAYARAKWADHPAAEATACASSALGPEWTERIDALGFDSERLLQVDAAGVSALVQELETEAMKEDRRVEAVAIEVRAREESAINRGATPPRPAGPSARNKHSKPAKRKRRRARRA